MPAPKELLVERIRRVRTALKDHGNNPILVTDPPNVGWLTGIPVDFQKDARVLVTPEKTYFITDGRYENRVPEIPGVETYIWGAKHPHFYPELEQFLQSYETLNLDTRGLPLDLYSVLHTMVGVKNLEAPSGFLDRLRMIKGDLELELIKEAVDIAIRQFRYMIDEWLPANKDTATDFDFRDAMVEWGDNNGGEGESFDMLVAMDGDADTPHPDMTREPTPLSEGQVMLVDWGIFYKGVCTDMTRMIILVDNMPPLIEGMKMLQEKWMTDVIEACKVGNPAYVAGNVYWDGLKTAGIDKPFHGAGHGTGGAYVHELPKLSGMKEGVDDYGITLAQSILLEPGMIITSEPGMYEKGEGAYRTENMILITESGREPLDAALSLDPFYV
ncbi:MAG: M24 family metallopeptidase [Candidatus Electryonea clarkiae]|nr:M24 family metallopeptidase [Candidatus Electryonea clarkiae]MDP8286290.1 M24 family metallopeptidase [Candidatus Electryonea clarkiae]